MARCFPTPGGPILPLLAKAGPIQMLSVLPFWIGDIYTLSFRVYAEWHRQAPPCSYPNRPEGGARASGVKASWRRLCGLHQRWREIRALFDDSRELGLHSFLFMCFHPVLQAQGWGPLWWRWRWWLGRLHSFGESRCSESTTASDTLRWVDSSREPTTQQCCMLAEETRRFVRV